MNANQKDVIKRIDKGDKVLEDNHGIWGLNLPMGASRAIMLMRRDLINSYGELQQKTLVGLTINKDFCCLRMGGKGMVLVSQMLVFYGMAPKNLIMIAKIGFSFTDLTTGSSEDIYLRNKVVSDSFDAAALAMIAAGIPVTVLMGTEYGTSITEYNDAVPGYGDGEAITAAATDQIAIECSTLTNEDIPTMKNFAFIYKEAHGLFYGTLENAYKATATAKSKESMHIHVTDEDTGIDLPNSTINRIASDTTILKVITGPKGIGVYSSSATDSYNFCFQRPGFYDKWVYNKGYTAGELLKFGVILKKIPPTTPPPNTEPIPPVDPPPMV